MAIDEAESHGIKLSDIGIPKEVMKDIGDSRAIVRELISNAGAEEVGASRIDVQKFDHHEYGLSFMVKDDGCGMKYTGEEENQGRLDRFLNLGYSRVSGLDADEFSHKGLGTALIYNSRKVEIETYNGDTLYHVIIDDPRGHFWKENPEPPEPRITAHKHTDRDKTGTKVTVLGFAGGDNGHYTKYSKSRMKEYLKWRTLVGCTNEERVGSLPTFTLKVDGEPEEEIEPGYPWITDGGSEDTVVFTPIITENEQNGTRTEVRLKGGMTTKIADNRLKERYAGLTISVNGIPYFRDRSFLERRFSDVGWKFTNLVAECDEINLNISRNNYHKDDTAGQLFESSLKQALRKLEDSKEFKEYQEHIRKQKREKKAGGLESRKRDLRDGTQKFVIVNGEAMHILPRSENDTLAVLWKMEAKKVLPFHRFRTLEHTGWEGIDLMVDIQENSESEIKECVTVEVERDFSNFERHGHSPSQTDYVICWNMNQESVNGNINKLNPHKYSYQTDDQVIQVFVLNEMEGVEIRQRSELDEYD